MPTDLPPDYKPEPPRGTPKPGEGKAPPAVPNPQGEDVKGQRPAEPPRPGAGLPGQPEGDVVDPPGWKQPPRGPDSDPAGVPSPAGTPVF